MKLKLREYLVHITYFRNKFSVLSTSLNSEAQEEKTRENNLPHV